jgi:hypothetical protein
VREFAYELSRGEGEKNMKRAMFFKLLCYHVIAVFLIPTAASATSQQINSVSVSVKPLGLDSWISLSLMNAAGASISQLPEFTARSEFKVVVRASGGGWIGLSFKDSRGNVYDVSPRERSGRNTEFFWTLPSSFQDGPIQLTVALWEDYNRSSNRMVGELDRYGWVYVARKTGGSSW